ncbi:pyridoxamine 5'-phosphate oxidase [Salipiger sp. IMCC34102]|uniref:pyridoxamine 5'-phosphate oxidase family protein n=1 Tax=Salipiger sp. IMCC34102 TaxID=2510647 RepID=UPI00101D3FE8|nr:pyridoxamine 5'-phosphate oxidase family protein [Salipiger sp. IMCC34102]RYH00826.1 pyridoxamine 5'-phosphate oxidase [Salipiger sp. IMCC34102]
MSDFDRSPDGLVFSPAVQNAQRRLGSRRVYEAVEWPIDISDDLERFITEQRSVFLATASADGQPYIQHRGGPPGFLHVLDSRTIGMADVRGNRQYVTLGNLSENDRVQLFLIDYAQAKRVKIWGRGRMVEDDSDLIARLTPEGGRARADRALLVAVEAWDMNCPQYIPHRLEAEDVTAAFAERDARIAELEHEVAILQHRVSVRDACGDDLW